MHAGSGMNRKRGRERKKVRERERRGVRVSTRLK